MKCEPAGTEGVTAALDDRALVSLRNLDRASGGIADLVALFADDGREIVRQLDQVVAADDPGPARDLAHRLKGASAAMAAPVLAGRCRGLERALAVGDAPGAAAELTALRLELERVITALQGEFPAIDAPS